MYNRTTLTDKTFTVCKFLTYETLIWPMQRTVRRVHCKQSYETFFVILRRVCMQPLTRESMSVSTFEHNFPSLHLMRRVTTKLYQLWDMTTCTFSLKRCICAPFWLTRTCPCLNVHTGGRVGIELSTFVIRNHVWEHWFDWCKGLRRVHCKKTFIYATVFDIQGRLRMQIFTQEDVSVCSLWPIFLCFISTTMFPHKYVHYKTRSCAFAH